MGKRNGAAEGEELLALGKVSGNDRRRSSGMLEIDAVQATVTGSLARSRL